MTRVVGNLFDADGPLNGRLYLKPSPPFLGGSKNISFRIEDGDVDINLPPCPKGTVWLAGWKNKFETGGVDYCERWIVPNVEEIDLDALRGFGRPQERRANRTDRLNETMRKVEFEEIRERMEELEKDNARLMHQLSSAEARAAAANGQLASSMADNNKLKRRLQDAAAPKVNVKERIVERKMLPAEAKEAIAFARREIALLQEENEMLEKQNKEAISLSTHFSNLHAEIDRLKNENQRLLRRIEDMKRPHRSASSLRDEAIANLDKLMDG